MQQRSRCNPAVYLCYAHIPVTIPLVLVRGTDNFCCNHVCTCRMCGYPCVNVWHGRVSNLQVQNFVLSSLYSTEEQEKHENSPLFRRGGGEGGRSMIFVRCPMPARAPMREADIVL